MRVSIQLYFAVALALLALATATPAEDYDQAPAASTQRSWKRLLGFCILGMPLFGDCNNSPGGFRPPPPNPWQVPNPPPFGGGPQPLPPVGGGGPGPGPIGGGPSPTPTAASTSTPGPTGGATNPPSGGVTDPTSPSSTAPTAPTPANNSTGPTSPTDAPVPTPTDPAVPTKPTTIGTTASIWSYPQAELPSRTASTKPAGYTPTGGSYIWPWKQTRTYNFNIQYAQAAPDGFLRRIRTINGEYPGPMIEANQGDTLVINVVNQLDIPQSIHWHGMRQNFTNHMDGVPGVHQCSIPPGGSYTYRFNLDNEFGTFWYHGHYANSMADGVYGPLIIHSRNDPLKQYQHFDSERVMMLTDWQHDDSMIISKGLMDMSVGYRGSPAPPNPDSILINGIGQTDCKSMQQDVQCRAKQSVYAEVKGSYGSKLRLRIINTGTHAMIRFSIDKHRLQVVEVDDTPIQPVWVNELALNSAQRYSVVVQLNQGWIGDSFWMRARPAGYCLGGIKGPDISAVGILRYTDFLGLTWNSKPIPNTQPWHDLADIQKSPCVDLDETNGPLVPMIPQSAPSTYDTVSFHSSFGRFIDPASGKPFFGFGYNGINFNNYINDPLLAQLERGLDLNNSAHAHTAHFVFPTVGAVDIIINQEDTAPFAHPFHLHGRPFMLVGRGKGIMTPELLHTVQLNTQNPLRRDTVTIDHESWAVLRLITDTPGVWPIHCHIGWHLAVGKMGVVVVQPDTIKNRFSRPADWTNLCAGTDPDELGPARRAGLLPPQARARHYADEMAARPIEA
ncbi:Laccase-2 [Vanrija pseudolonga]|uniref:Laccase-2 n=1 Tax=Vanrija pseudolonga TaxID=143232 RepID=A0AAF0Y1J8_9TREE|nr:Laccase-2 [Vanrija pseudolonga]